MHAYANICAHTITRYGTHTLVSTIASIHLRAPAPNHLTTRTSTHTLKGDYNALADMHTERELRCSRGDEVLTSWKHAVLSHSSQIRTKTKNCTLWVKSLVDYDTKSALSLPPLDIKHKLISTWRLSTQKTQKPVSIFVPDRNARRRKNVLLSLDKFMRTSKNGSCSLPSGLPHSETCVSTRTQKHEYARM